MERLWAPWRIKYIQTEKGEGCILCDKPKEGRDTSNYILFRGDKNFIIMNSYPYNPGHLMIAPYRHIANFEDLNDEELHELFKLVRRGAKVLKQLFDPAGFNIGINIGRVAGAGIENHIHAHIVPRWQGDLNFMAVVSDVKVLPEALKDTYDKLKGRF